MNDHNELVIKHIVARLPVPYDRRVNNITDEELVEAEAWKEGIGDDHLVSADAGAPYTCVNAESPKALFGKGNVSHSCYNMAIQDHEKSFICHVSKADFQEVNILRADAMQYLHLSISVDWK